MPKRGKRGSGWAKRKRVRFNIPSIRDDNVEEEGRTDSHNIQEEIDPMNNGNIPVPSSNINPRYRVGSKEWLNDPTINQGASTSKNVPSSSSVRNLPHWLNDPTINQGASTSRYVPNESILQEARPILLSEENIEDSSRQQGIDVPIFRGFTLPIAWCGLSIPNDLCEDFRGTFTEKCPHCKALFFKAERNYRLQYNHCCSGGKVQLPPLSQCPHLLQDLLSHRHPLSKHFMENIRKYNSSLSFTSIQVSLANQFPGRGPYIYRIHGSMYHQISHGTRNQNQVPPRYSQLYVYDAEEALRERMGIYSTLNRGLLRQIDLLLREVNPFAKSYRKMKEVEEDVRSRLGQNAVRNVRMWFTDRQHSTDVHRGRVNAPVSTEVAVIFESSSGVPDGIPLLCVFPIGTGLKTIERIHPFCDPLSYVIFFPKGDRGWSTDMDFSKLQYYCYRLSFRADDFNIILRGGKLSQQFIVDAYCFIEGSRLRFIEQRRQMNLRIESYRGLMDHLQNVGSDSDIRVGLPIILPSTFIGSPRNMQQNFQDAMAIVRQFGKPDLFLTFTCNPNWREIKENLLPGQSPVDRPDLTARVFDMKRWALIHDITKNGILGKVVAHIHVIEFQKRGLPHMHLLIILSDEYKIRDIETVDKIVCAEIPDEQSDSQLYSIVTSNMIHGPCGALNPNSVCMINNKCSKNYPKNFSNETVLNENGYPIYRRRDNGRFITVRGNRIDNRWVVPYNPYLSKKYNAHINVEICCSVKSVKYLFKYVYKGHDCASIVFVDDDSTHRDEIAGFLNARYVSSQEAFWRIFEKTLQHKSHSIFRLAVHLPFMQNVAIRDNRLQEAFDRASRVDTHLTGFFKLNQNDPFARQLLYLQIPKFYVWKDNTWRRRKRGSEKVIPRIYSVSVRDTERYHLRMLLHYVKGVTSFEDIRTFNGVVYSTFKDACRARNLLEDDSEWRKALQEASLWQMPSALRQLFVTICVFCSPNSPLELWEEFKGHLSEDFLRRCNNESESFRRSLTDIGRILIQYSETLENFGLPSVPQSTLEQSVEDFDPSAELEKYTRLYPLLNPEQKQFFDEVLKAVNTDSCTGKLFHLNAFAGAGKSFVLNCILHRVRGDGLTAIAVAWSGIAATLLEGGTTVHSRFKLPVPILENSVCRIKANSREGRFIKECKVIIWDECTMVPNIALTVIDRFLRDLMGNDDLFGGKVLILSGDWRQILPVSLHANKTLTIESCIKRSPFWHDFRQFTLTQNMRTSPDEVEFSNWLLKLGDGKLRNPYGFQRYFDRDIIEIPAENISSGNIVNDIFGNDFNSISEDELASRAILSTKSDCVLKLNEDILSKVPGESKVYYSADSISCDDSEEEDMYPLEYIHTLTPSGMPPHKLTLKKGAIIMLLRNLNIRSGLCNGTRLIIRELMDNVIDAEIIVGKNRGNRIFIPRITLTPSDTNLPFKLKRRQFPVRLSYAMTINKAQGQSLNRVGIYLEEPVFSHGMLYVAFSRARNRSSVRVYVKDTSRQGKLLANSQKVFTENIVYKEIL